MSGLLAGTGSFGLFGLACLASLRLYCGQNYYKIFAWVYVAFIPVLLALQFYLWKTGSAFWPAVWQEPARMADLLIAFMLYTLLVHGFWNFAHGAALTGFSAGILVAMRKRHPQPLSVAEALDWYGVQQGENRAVLKRLEQLTRKGYLINTPEGFGLTPLSRHLTQSVYFLKKIFKMGVGG